MPDTTPLYLEAKPGDLITADNWNELQRRVQKDIVDTTEKAVQGVTDVNHAKDSDHLEGKTADQLANEIVQRAVQEIRTQSGYQQIFTVLNFEPQKKGQDQQYRVIAHKLGLEPLVDVYRLDYFPVVYRRDQQTFTGWATFYLFHTSEKKIRFTGPDGKTTTSIEIQPTNGPAYKIAWKILLDRYKVQYDDDTSLDDLLTDFWTAFLASPNDGFDETQYGHSPWFEKCCSDERTVKDLKRSGEWDDLWLKMVPEKIAFFPAPLALIGRPSDQTALVDLQTQVQVTHFDFDTTGLRLLTAPFYPDEQLNPAPEKLIDPLGKQIPDYVNELKIMVLLKV
jgi:hypothetical protein